MSNRFRDPMMRQQYDAAVKAFEIKHRDLFTKDGEQHIGSSFARAFWDGFNGRPGLGLGGYASERNSLGYAYWRAGQDCQKGQKIPARPGRPALPPDQAQTAMIRERVTEAQRAEYEARGGKAWLVAALNRKRK